MLTLNLDTPLDKQRKTALRMRELRMQRNLRQEDLAVRSGVALGTLRRFERTGEISLSSLAKLALALGTLDDLDHLFEERPATSIAEIEARESKCIRQRVRERH